MMYKFAENGCDGILLMLFTGTTIRDHLAIPLVQTLTPKVLGVVDFKYTNTGILKDVLRVGGGPAGACNLMTSVDRFSCTYDGQLYSAELVFSTLSTYGIRTNSGKCVGTMKVDFRVNRERGPCPDKLLEEMLAQFPEQEYETLSDKPVFR